VPSVNRRWLDELTQTANSGTGLLLVEEPRERELVPA
jgi:hypothetical protein